jgi:hypothetical protein
MLLLKYPNTLVIFLCLIVFWDLGITGRMEEQFFEIVN